MVPLLHEFGFVGKDEVLLIGPKTLSEVSLDPRKENILEDRLLVDFFVNF